jgi:glycosyltransferase involved in cell wall biosynthesis
MQLYKKFSPLVSIILPTYNRENYITRSIDSVLKQSFDNWELIIIDDGSSDNTGTLVSDYLSNDERIFYLKKNNSGVPISRNVGIKLSSGTYLTFIDSDDEYKYNHLESRINELEKDKSIDCLHGGLEIKGDPFVIDKNDRSKKIHISECIVCGTLFGKRDVFLKTGGFKDLSYSAESEFYERAIKNFTFKKFDLPTYIYYRQTPDSICNSI